MHNIICDRVVFDGADLSKAIFANAVLSGTTFTNANLKDTDFTDSYLGCYVVIFAVYPCLDPVQRWFNAFHSL